MKGRLRLVSAKPNAVLFPLESFNHPIDININTADNGKVAAKLDLVLEARQPIIQVGWYLGNTTRLLQPWS